MDDFWFRGRHVREFGAVAAFGATVKTGGKVKRGNYALPGGGSVAIGEDEWQETQRTVRLMPMDGTEADDRWQRRILSWLQAGRGELVVDHDPDVVRYAEFNADGTYSWDKWPTGALELTMTLMPIAYDALETQRTVHVAADQDTAIGFGIQSALPVPIRAALRVTSGHITGATIGSDGYSLVMPSLHIDPGDVLMYDGGMIAGQPSSLTVNGRVDFSSVDGGRWARLMIAPGGGLLHVQLTGGEADVTISARGRWPA